MNVLLGDFVTVQREVGEDLTYVSGRISGVVLSDRGDLKYFYIKGISESFWMNDGWKFQEEVEENEDEDNG